MIHLIRATAAAWERVLDTMSTNQPSKTFLRRLEFVEELFVIFKLVEESLYGLRLRYSSLHNWDPSTFGKRFIKFSNTPPALDVIFRLCNNLHRFQLYYLTDNHILHSDTATKDSIKNNFKKLCVRVRDYWLRYMIFDNFTLNLVSVDAEKLISVVAMNVQRPIVDDYPCALAEAVRLLIAEKGELSLETWRTYDPWLWSCSDSLGNYLRYLSLDTNINSTTALCHNNSPVEIGGSSAYVKTNREKPDQPEREFRNRFLGSVLEYDTKLQTFERATPGQPSSRHVNG